MNFRILQSPINVNRYGRAKVLKRASEGVSHVINSNNKKLMGGAAIEVDGNNIKITVSKETGKKPVVGNMLKKFVDLIQRHSKLDKESLKEAAQQYRKPNNAIEFFVKKLDTGKKTVFVLDEINEVKTQTNIPAIINNQLHLGSEQLLNMYERPVERNPISVANAEAKTLFKQVIKALNQEQKNAKV